jgi:hypothetical protein
MSNDQMRPTDCSGSRVLVFYENRTSPAIDFTDSNSPLLSGGASLDMFTDSTGGQGTSAYTMSVDYMIVTP